MTRHSALSALLGILRAVLVLSVVWSTQADAASPGGATALSQPAPGLSEADTDILYLKLDASNGPLTGDLTLGTNVDIFCGTANNCNIGTSNERFNSLFISDVFADRFTARGAVERLKFVEPDGSRFSGPIDSDTGAVEVDDVDGLNLSAGVLSLGIGRLESTVADGEIGFDLNVINPHSTANLFQVREAGGAAIAFITAGGEIFSAEAHAFSKSVDVRKQIINTIGTNGCTTSTGAVCNLDDLQVDGFVAIEESTIPTVPLNYGAFWFASDNTAHAITGDGVDHTISLVETFHAEGKDADNTDAFGVSVDLNFECYHTNGLVGDDLVGFTFDAGGGGISFPIASIADGGGGEIAVTTTGDHGLAVGDIVSQANLTDATYEGVRVVNAVTSSTVYEVTSAFTATDTGTLNQCASLIASAGSAGDYLVTWTASVTGVTNNETFDVELFVEAGGDGTTVRESLGMAGVFFNLHNTVIITIADGDHLSLGIENQDSAGDIIIRQLTIVMTRL